MNLIKATVHKGKKENLTSDIVIFRSIPNRYTQAIGSMVFLDHLVEQSYDAKTPEMPDGSFAHPHRGIATFSYLLKGAVHHIDSAGGEGVVYAGGIQWMKAGSGIIHDEFFPYDFQESGGTLHALQFWLNLPAKNKGELPEYIAVQSEDIPEIQLTNQKGKLKVLLGEFEGSKSVIPNYLKQFMYHIQLNAEESTELPVNELWQFGVYLVKGSATINDTVKLNEVELAELSNLGKSLRIENTKNSTLDIMVFGGEPYTEPMVPYGPFVMNTRAEIAQAYVDYQKGKYGQMDYSKVEL